MKKGLKSFLISFFVFLVIGYAAGVVVAYFLPENGVSEFSVDLLTSDYAFIGAAVGAVIGICWTFFTKPKKKKSEATTTGKTASGEEVDLHYDAKWLKPEDFGKYHGIIDTTWSQLPSLKKTGTIFRSVVEGGKYHIAMKDEYHCLIIGSTGSGKTSFIFIPSIRIYAHSGEKPCMVVTDPKGELYQKTSRICEDEGYRVMKLDLRDPFSSTRWNPMEHAYDTYHKGLDCRNHIKKCTDGRKPKSLGFDEVTGAKYGETWYGFEGVAYPDEESLRVAVNSQEQIYKTEAYNELRSICNTIAPKSPNVPDPTWEEGAQDFLYGVSLAMLEDSADPELGMTKEKFNFFNLYKIATYRDPDPDAPFQTLQKYLLEGRDEATSNVPNLTSSVVNNAPGTTKSYMGVLNGKISFMSDIGIAYLTSQSDVSFDTFIDKPTVFYLVIPDDRKERHNLAVLCVSQIYQRLVAKANEFPGQKLPKRIYFILDEFGNMPRIAGFEEMITVSRGRNMFFEIVVQSYTQLDVKYGADNGKTIRGNCNMQIYVGTDDQHTNEEFSKLCGDVQLVYNDKSESKTVGGKTNDDSKNVNTNTQRSTRPLISAYELGQIKFGESIVKMLRYPAMRLWGTRNDQVPVFYVKEAAKEVGATKSLDTQKVAYDIKMRNAKVLKSTNSGGGNDPFGRF